MSLSHWILAARPKTLTGAALPVLAGGSLAVSQQGFDHSWFLWTGCLLFAFLMQVDANFINDLYDFKKGTDREDRLGPERACAQGWITPQQMQRGILVVTVLACLVGLLTVGMVWQQLPFSGIEFVVIGALCVLFAFLYTTRLSYLGWGDVLVLVFFGFVPTCGTYYLLTFTLDWAVVLLSLICGLTIDTLLIVNNYRDRDQDRLSGKKTIVVRFGETFALDLHLCIGVAVCLLCFHLDNWMNVESRFASWGLDIAGVVYFFMNTRTNRRMHKIHAGKALNSCLASTSINMLVLTLLLSLSLVLSALER
ncbi:MAG: 1,4-dihydroxy-2-naphthoate octaprenyltransferase [Bacteroidales bacterium]|nr:1,4-dihydroxy-2-naphthoate octaprenyltransferase [Bacteroidales bacterium]